MSTPVVGFAGMTHLGINSAVATAAHGFDVLAYDAGPALVADLQSQRFPIMEPGLGGLVAKVAKRLSFTTDPRELARCDVVYVSTDVPTDDDARSDLHPIETAIRTAAANLAPHAILAVLCQVPPGFTRRISVVPKERLVYQVETLIFGRAIERAMYPERFIVGCADPPHLPTRYRAVLEAFGCPILPMRYESAELAKISINFCLVASVSVANTLAEVSEAIGADWSEIIPALKLDKRIGPHAYLAPGLGISGGNLERDLRTIVNIAADKHTDSGIVDAWLANSAYRKDWCWRMLRRHVLQKNPGARIAVLGLAYKENTNSTKNSPSLVLLGHLEGADVTVHDPLVPASIVPFAKPAGTAAACVEGADVAVIATPWPEYRRLTPETLSRAMAGRVLIDPYRLIEGAQALAAGFTYVTLGTRPLLPSTC